MGLLFDSVPLSGIARVRDMMYGVRDPFRLDQGDVSFDAPETVKEGMRRAIADNHSHYLPTAGVPRLRELLAEKLRRKNGLPIGSPDEVFVTQGGMHAMYLACRALCEPGDEVIVPDPTWPAVIGNLMAAQAVPVRCPLRERLAYRFDLGELAAAVTPRTRGIYLNSPHNPTGGVLTRSDLESIADLAARHDLWILSDEAYEDIVYDDAKHVSIGSIGDAYSRTILLYTFSKSYAMTGLRLGYLAVKSEVLRARIVKLLFLTVSNPSSVVQYGGIAALEGSQECVEQFRRELQCRRDLFYDGIVEASHGVLRGTPPLGAFYAFLRIADDWEPEGRGTGGTGGRGLGAGGLESPDAAAGRGGLVSSSGDGAMVSTATTGALQNPAHPPSSRSWALVEQLISRGRIGCVPGVDFGPHGEDHVRFCFCRDRSELTGALASMGAALAAGG